MLEVVLTPRFTRSPLFLQQRDPEGSKAGLLGPEPLVAHPHPTPCHEAPQKGRGRGRGRSLGAA